MIQKIMFFFWYLMEVEEVVVFYVGIFLDLWIVCVMVVFGIDGMWMVEFELFGQLFFVMSYLCIEMFNYVILLFVSCVDQVEFDCYWSVLFDNGGMVDGCGWLWDCYGVLWQIVLEVFILMMVDCDMVKVGCVVVVMMQMIKFDDVVLKVVFVGIVG